jgi:hypothetical protein
VLTRKEFVRVVNNAVLGLGFSQGIAKVVFPVDLFLVESDLSPITENIDQFIEGLTKWTPPVQGKTVIKPPMIEIEGKDYQEAFANMNKQFLTQMWGDGLPLLPATPERVHWILRGTDLSPDTNLGKILPKGRIATVETLAVALAMAGGRPEYLPVLIAALEGILDPGIRHQNWQATSSSIYPATIVNGPIAKQIRLNSGFGLLGPDSQHPAGARIGRAIRLLLQNVGGALPGVGTMAQFGGMRFTNAVFAEDEDGLPPGWKPLNVEYFGSVEGANTMAVYPVSSASNVLRRGTGKETLKDEALAGLQSIAAYMRSPNVNMFEGYVGGAPGILLLSSIVANQLAGLGWTKESIKDFLWENSKIPMSDIKKWGFIQYIQDRGIGDTIKDPWPITSKPKNIMIVVAGGRHPTHAYWMQAAQGPRTVIKQITLPTKWGNLLKEAEEELGPLPPL